MGVTESEFGRALWVALNAGPTRVERVNAGVLKLEGGRVAHGARKGTADLVGWVRPEGWHLEVEVKVDAPHTKQQRARGAAIERDGAIYVLVRWDHALSLEANVVWGVDRVQQAIEARRKRA